MATHAAYCIRLLHCIDALWIWCRNEQIWDAGDMGFDTHLAPRQSAKLVIPLTSCSLIDEVAYRLDTPPAAER